MTTYTSTTNYLTPGVYIQQVATPSVPVPSTIPSTLICIVGDSINYTTGQDNYSLIQGQDYTISQLGVATTGTSPITLTNGSIVDRFTGQVYTAGTDYVVAIEAATDGESIDTITTITPAFPGKMFPYNSSTNPTGVGSGFVLVNYQYTNSQYYQPYIFTSYNAVSSFYGSPLTSSGAINSPLTLGAYFAFQNGAPQVMCLAVEPIVGNTDDQNYIAAINSLANQTGIDAIVPMSGDSSVHNALNSYVNVQALSSNYTRGFVGLDGVINSVNSSTIAAEANSFDSSRMIVVSPPILTFNAGVIGSTGQAIIYLGGEYAAAGLAGLFAGQSGVQIPLTQKSLSGFYSIPNQLTLIQTISLQAAGVCCLYQNRSGEITIQQGLTTNMSNYLTREISVQAAEDKLYQILYNTLISQNLIGSVITGTTPLTVVSSVSNALNVATQAGLIQGYDTITYSIPPNAPTTININFLYLPSLPLNYIQVQYGIDTNSGATGFSSTISGLPATSAA